MIRSKDQPTQQEEGNIKYETTDHETYDARNGQSQGDQQYLCDNNNNL